MRKGKLLKRNYLRFLRQVPTPSNGLRWTVKILTLRKIMKLFTELWVQKRYSRKLLENLTNLMQQCCNLHLVSFQIKKHSCGIDNKWCLIQPLDILPWVIAECLCPLLRSRHHPWLAEVEVEGKSGHKGKEGLQKQVWEDFEIKEMWEMWEIWEMWGGGGGGGVQKGEIKHLYSLEVYNSPLFYFNRTKALNNGWWALNRVKD